MTDTLTTELLPCPFCGGEADVMLSQSRWGQSYTIHHDALGKCPAEYVGSMQFVTEAEAIAAWNSRAPEQAVAATLGSEKCARCAEDMGKYADSLCDPLKERVAELLRCLENDWNIRASWDGLRRFWCIELTEEGVRLRDAESNSRGRAAMTRQFEQYSAYTPMPTMTTATTWGGWQAINLKCLGCKHHFLYGTASMCAYASRTLVRTEHGDECASYCPREGENHGGTR